MVKKITGLLCLVMQMHFCEAKTENDSVVVLHRYIAIDNVCAWPNLTKLGDGRIAANIFSEPSHGRRQGDVECWVSTGETNLWSKAGIAAPHKPLTNRMNVASGLAVNGDLVVIASGWSLKKGDQPEGYYDLNGVIGAWVSRSADAGKTWKVSEKAFPGAEPGFTEYIPFGDILKGADGTLRVLAYNQSSDKIINTLSVFKSDDDGRHWRWLSKISDAKNETAFAGGHNETAFFYTGSGKWIAAARRWKAGAGMDLFTSSDDGRSWKMTGAITEAAQHPAHITRLENGDLLLTYGNRKKNEYGVAVKVSKDNGVTWSTEKIVISDLTSSDCGYPSSVQLKDGSILTAYYAKGHPVHDRYHMGTVVWKFD